MQQCKLWDMSVHACDGNGVVWCGVLCLHCFVPERCPVLSRPSGNRCWLRPGPVAMAWLLFRPSPPNFPVLLAKGGAAVQHQQLVLPVQHTCTHATATRKPAMHGNAGESARQIHTCKRAEAIHRSNCTDAGEHEKCKQGSSCHLSLRVPARS